MIGKLLGHTQVQTTARYAPWVIYGTSPVAGSSTYSRSGSGRELALA
jgi:hypothetical protein